MGTMPGFFLCAISLVCLSAFSVGTEPPRSTPVSVAAIAADAQAVVLRHDQGLLRRYAVGDIIANSNWRIARITANEVRLELSQRLDGKPIGLHLTLGQNVDLDAANTTVNALRMPHVLPTAISTQPLLPPTNAKR